MVNGKVRCAWKLTSQVCTGGPDGGHGWGQCLTPTLSHPVPGDFLGPAHILKQEELAFWKPAFPIQHRT